MKMTLIKTITEHGSQINSFYLLKDNRVAACSNDKVKRVYNPNKDYQCDEIIKK